MLKKLGISATAFVMLLAAVLTAGQANAQGADPFTGLPAGTGTHTPPPKVAVGACAVMWDLTHGVFLDYEPAGVFSGLVALLATQAISVSTTTAGLDHIDLSPYSVIVINQASNWNSPYTPSEVAAIQSFQAHGGGLLIMGDNINTNNANISPISVPLGTTCGLSLIDPLDLFISNFIPHVIFTGVNTIYMRAAGRLGVTPPSIVAAIDPAGDAVVSVVNSPRTVITGDVNLWDNTYMTSDNQQFAMNVFKWLCLAGATPTKASSWGRLKTLYR
jgi:hypothetical protein